tara:strand:- start:76 stop:213 length:138 start_codon:yes stop_codon:yes gene_type:complete
MARTWAVKELRTNRKRRGSSSDFLGKGDRTMRINTNRNKRDSNAR